MAAKAAILAFLSHAFLPPLRYSCGLAKDRVKIRSAESDSAIFDGAEQSVLNVCEHRKPKKAR
jgi:hypothetical protein